MYCRRFVCVCRSMYSDIGKQSMHSEISFLRDLTLLPCLGNTVALLTSKQEPCMQVNESLCQELQLIADRSVCTIIKVQ